MIDRLEGQAQGQGQLLDGCIGLRSQI